ncbi:arginine / lysine / ornithine decarboxylase [Caloranaerobacter sp. TR13]|uniref:aminotransferase class I/II-fold pyridoxal phosphate-dependent enzyme n=1 Tax=Caloranaerobacter sp. TR13 TaxID=1302151 RepID=UPI0006D3C02A|nr:aminotransferase class I/II-fold pyridoxal phosphate-dependent enzyme [Caloranaerobacter sp. TR13]KPU27512.1 arginine / lysine / ornithine decarboxylase [Caloranaerobacter sp. TR13]
MRVPIIEGLNNYINKNKIRFHMPGHKGKEALIDWVNLIPQIDVTEIEGTDNLHSPSSIILESLKLASKTFKTKRTYYSVNGTTAGIYAAIMSSTKPGDKILIQRNCHKSVYNAIILGKLNPIYIYPNYNNEYNIVTDINPDDIEKALSKHGDIKAVVITNPSYYGVCSDVESIAKIVHKHNKVLIVDEAHGSHLIFSNKLPKSAIESGADIVLQSTHKTLPAFTQSSMIHVCSSRVDLERLETMLSIHMTTSPSYILMSSLDFARAYMAKEGQQKLNTLIQNIEKVTSLMNNIKGVKIFNGRDKKVCFDFDITKILINLTGININGSRLEEILSRDYDIQVEMSDIYYVLALATVFDEYEDLEKLALAIEDIARKEVYRIDKVDKVDYEYIKPKTRISIYDAFYNEVKYVEITKSIGKISANFIIPYPPGIPILCPGEEITDEIVKYINYLKTIKIPILGLSKDSNEIKIIK